MIPLRVFSDISALKMVVEVGFVQGTTPQINPTGAAMTKIPYSSSSSMTPQVLSSLYYLL